MISPAISHCTNRYGPVPIEFPSLSQSVRVSDSSAPSSATPPCGSAGRGAWPSSWTPPGRGSSGSCTKERNVERTSPGSALAHATRDRTDEITSPAGMWRADGAWEPPPPDDVAQQLRDKNDSPTAFSSPLLQPHRNADLMPRHSKRSEAGGPPSRCLRCRGR